MQQSKDLHIVKNMNSSGFVKQLKKLFGNLELPKPKKAKNQTNF